MRAPLGLALLLGAVLAIPAPAVAAPPVNEERDLVDKVNRSIDRGIQFLRVANNGKNWEGYFVTNTLLDGGVTALATLALLNCGVKPEEKEVRAALEYLRGVPRNRTYCVALITMVLAEARLPRDKPIIQENADWLLKTAMRSGGRITGWTYPFGENAPPDGSNTQYALLGLYAAKMAGAKIRDEDWEQIRGSYLKGLRKEGDNLGSWSYTPGGGASFTMTVAGVSGLHIAGMGLDLQQQQLNVATGVAARCGKYDENDAINRGLNYIGRNFTFTRGEGVESTYYNIYGLERVGRLSGQRFIGRVDWYRAGCEYLVREQNRDGGWTQKQQQDYDSIAVISTSFALLFLSKGRTPVLISKFAHGDFTNPDNGTLVERGGEPNVVGWNRKHNDVRQITAFASRELFKGMQLGWQVYDPRRRELARTEDILAEVGALVQSPILYINGHERLNLRGQHKEILKKYVEEGGFIVAEACCGSEEFANSYRELMKELFPENKLQPIAPQHPIWQSFFAVPPTEFPKLMTMDRGCRTVMVFSPEPLAGYWEESRFMASTAKVGVNRGEQAFRLAGNIVAYATGMEPPQQRLTTRRIADVDKVVKSPPKGFLKPAQLRIPGEQPPAPAAMRNVTSYLRTNARLDAVLETENLSADSPDLFKYKFLYMHGRKSFTLSEAEVLGLRATLQTGGLLLADSCCGKPEFDQSFRTLVGSVFPNRKLEPIPLDDELYSEKTNGSVISSVKRREKASTSEQDVGFQDLPPALEGIKVDGKWAIVYSKYDLGCALEGHKSSDCLGHTRESALKLAAAAVLYSLKK